MFQYPWIEGGVKAGEIFIIAAGSGGRSMYGNKQMTIKLVDQIRSDMLVARKARDGERTVFLSTLLGEMTANAVVVDGGKVVTDEAATAVLKKFLKGLNEMPTDEKVAREKFMVESYLPKMMDDATLSTTIRAYMNSGVLNIGGIMGFLKKDHPNQYDGKRASEIFKELLEAT